MEVFKGEGYGISIETPAACDCRCYIRCKGSTYPNATAWQDWQAHLTQ
jgi:hypothetical protein